MTKNISYILYKIFKFLDKIFFLITKKSLFPWFNIFLNNDSYETLKILDKKIKFFSPNYITNWRIKTFFKKEPETLEWIDSFKSENKIIFWDIGANIGLYSLYAAAKHNDNIEVFAFEPSTSNLRALSRNISINNFDEIIKIGQFALTNKENEFLAMNEADFLEGGALNSFGENYNFEGKKFKGKNRYKIYGTTINYLIRQNILSVPNYIKIDVDGIEHLILQEANECLANKNLKNIAIEINENFTEQMNVILKIMDDAGFYLKHKKQSHFIEKNSKFSNTYNYLFFRK